MADIFDSATDAINRALNPTPGAPPPAPAAPPPPAPEDQATAAINYGLANPAAAPMPSAPESWGDWTKNVGQNMATGILKGVGNLAGLPNVAGRLGDKAMDLMIGTPPPAEVPGDFPTYTPGQPGWLTRHTYSPEDINSAIFSGISDLNVATGGKPVKPYEPKTPEGRIAQAALSNVIPSMVGPAEGLLTRVASGMSGGAAAEKYHELNPDDPYGQFAVGLLGAGAGGLAGSAAGAGTNFARGLLSPAAAMRAAEPTVASRIATAAGVPGADVARTIATNLPQWTPGTRPDLGNVLESPGVRGMVYKDMTAAQRAGDSTYVQNALATNEAQRAAVAGATPSDAATKLTQLTNDRDAALAAIPPGLSAQEAGSNLRSNLQTIFDQRAAARAAKGSMFDALETSPAQVNFQPTIDFATDMAARNAGEVGDAYKAALGSFKSATGLTLDTAPFANSVLKSLNDLKGRYQPGSAGLRAVQNVQAHLEDQLATQVPEALAARQTWAANSEPLDVFKEAPFGKVLAMDRFRTAYTQPNDAVAHAFLTGNGAADGLDKLNGIFGSPEAATRGLQEYIAGQVQQNAVRNGEVDLGGLNRVMSKYQNALMRFPTLQKQFSTAEGAQQALNQQRAYQQLYDTVGDQLGTLQRDVAGNPVYSANKFNDFVQQNGDLIDQAYTPEQAAVVRRVNDELTNQAQTAYSKVPGTSGTAQLIKTAAEHGGALMHTVMGALLGHLLGFGGETGALIGSAATGVMTAARHQSAAALEAVQRQALTDPEFARSLMLRYDPGMPSSAAVRAMRYVGARTPALAAPNFSPGAMTFSAPPSFAPQATPAAPPQ